MPEIYPNYPSASRGSKHFIRSTLPMEAMRVEMLLFSSKQAYWLQNFASYGSQIVQLMRMKA